MSRTYGASSSRRRRSPSDDRDRGEGSSRRRYDDEDRHRDRDRRDREDHRNGRDERDRERAPNGSTTVLDLDTRRDQLPPTLDEFKERAARRVAREREARGDDPDEDAGEEQEEQDERLNWSISNFDNVPITYAAASADLRTARSKSDRLHTYLQNGMAALVDAARDCESVTPGHRDVDKMQIQLQRLLDADKLRDAGSLAVQEVLDGLRAKQVYADVPKELERRTKAHLGEYPKLTSRQKFKNSDMIREFRTTVWNVHRSDEPMPPLSSFLPREDGDPESDDEIEAGGTMQTYRCPISLTHFVDACKSKTCGHHYSYAAIVSHIDASGRRAAAKCPVGACNAQLSRADIIRDPRMQKEADAFVARLARRQAEEDDYEEI